MHSNDIFLISFHFFLFCLSVLKPGHIFTKSQKRPAKKVNKCQTWINSVHVWDLLIIVRVLCIKKYIDFMSTLSSLRSSLWHYNRCQLWPTYDSNIVLNLLQRKIWRDHFINMAGGKIRFYLRIYCKPLGKMWYK